MSNWEILGIQATNDEDEIRRAYMMELTKHHPEDDPEGFAKLRNAYEEVLRELSKAEEENTQEEEDTPVSRWIARVSECYEDYPSRINEEAWKTLLEDEVCYQLEAAEEASEKLLVYLMDHFRLPREIWQLFEQVFHWTDHVDDLYRMFPTDFVNFMRNSLTGDDDIEFKKLEIGLGVESSQIDEWIRNYMYLVRYYNDDDLENVDKYLEILSQYDIHHPKIDLIQMYYAAHTGQEAEAVAIGRDFLAAYPDNKDAYYAIGETFLKTGEEEEGISLLNQFIEDNPYHFYAHLELVQYYIKHPEEIIEAEPSVDVLASYYSNDERVTQCLSVAYEALIKYYEAHMDLSDEDNKYQLACYYRGIQELDTCEKICNELLETSKQRGRIYYLLSKICVARDDLEKAIEYTTAWLEEAIEEDEKAAAYEKRGMLYNYLNRYDEALESFNRAIEIDDQNLSLQIKKLYSLNELQRYEELTECAQQLVDQKHEQSALYYYLAQGKFNLGEYGEALNACRENLRLNPYEENAYVIQAKIFYNVEQYEDALFVIDRAKSFGIEQNEELLYFEALTLRATREVTKAAEICQNLIELYEENDRAYYLYARIKNEMGEYEEALKLIDESIRLKGFAFKYDARADLNERLGAYEDAIEDYKTQLRLLEEEGAEHEEFADAYNNMGYAYARFLRNDEEAFKCYQKTIEYDDKHNRVYHNIGEYYERREDYEKALEAYSKQIEIYEDDYYLVSRGWCYIYLERYEEARKDFEVALEYNSNNGYAMNGIGCIYKRQGEYEEAETYFRKAIELDEDCMIAYENLGNCLNNLEKYNEAIEVYSTAIEKCPDREYYYLDRGDMHRYMGEYEEALKDYQLAEDTDARNYYIYYNRGLVYTRMGKLQKAIECFKQVIAMNDKHADSYCEIGDRYDEIGDCDLAIIWYKKANEADPMYCRSYNNLGAVYFSINRVDEAYEVYKKALEIDPEYRWSMVGVADCYRVWKQYDKAIEVLKQTIELYPRYLLAYRKLGKCYDEIRRYDEGIECLKQVLEIDPEYLAALNELGFIYLNKEDLDEAIECFEKIIELDEEYAGAYRGLGLVYEKKKEYRKAYEYCAKSAKIDPNEPCFCQDTHNMTLKYLKNYEEILELFKDLLQQNNKNYELSQYTANILKEMGHIDEAKELYFVAINGYKEIIKQEKADACTYYNLGECYKGLEDLAESKSYYTEAIQRASRCSDCNEAGCFEGHYGLGRIYEEQGYYEAALTQYKMAASLNLEEVIYKEAVRRMEEKLQ